MTKAKKKLLLVSALAISIVSIFVAIGLNEQGEAKGRLELARRAADALGVPRTLEAYRTMFQVPEEAENAWPLYVQTLRQYRPSFASTDMVERLSAPTPAEVELRPIWRDVGFWLSGIEGWRPRAASGELLERIGPILDSARELSTRPAFHIEHRFRLGIAEDFQDVVHIEDLASLLVFDAFIAAQRGELERARSDLAVCASISRHLFQMPVWHLFERGVNVASLTLGAAKWLIGSGWWPLEREAELRAAIEPALYEPDFRMLFKGVVFRGLLAIETFSSAQTMREAGLGRRATNRSAPRPAVREQTETAWLEASVAILREWPDDDDPAKLKEVVARHQRAFGDALHSYNRYIQTRTEATRTLEPLVSLYQAHLARVRVIKAYFKCLKALESTGRPPARLPTDARDPYNGQQLGYWPLGEGFAVSSVGADGKDDGGSREQVDQKPRDWVARYPDSRSGW